MASPGLRAFVALGAIAHDAVLSALGLRRALFRFGHGAVHALPDGRLLADSYHCSRLNTNTGKLTPAMFEAVFAEILDRIEPGRGQSSDAPGAWHGGGAAIIFAIAVQRDTAILRAVRIRKVLVLFDASCSAGRRSCWVCCW